MKKNTLTKALLSIGMLLQSVFTVAASSSLENWWPVQKRPDYVLKCTLSRHGDVREMNVAQSLCGLAAQAINEGLGNEGLWVENSIPDYQQYYKAWLKRLKVKERGSMSTWEVVKRFKQQGYIKGYVLYNYNRKDNSINLATIQAGLLKGILVDVSQEEQAKALGLQKLYDASKENLSSAWFEDNKSRLNNHFIVLANPAIANNRDYAIAHKGMVYYGVDSLLDTVLEWVCPLSPVIGWNSGPEFQHIEPCSNWGLINTASDWCMNLSMLSITGNEKRKKVKTVDPTQIKWEPDAAYHSFVMSDGDNMQWTLGNFIHNPDFWSNKYNEQIPMSFTTCLVNLSMAAPDVLNVLMTSQPRNVSLAEYGGGYYYPDLFAAKRSDRKQLLREFGRIVNTHIQQIGIKVFGFICHKVDSEEALTAYRIFAEELEGITGMLAVQYAPYNGGYGKVFWVKDKKGNEIPVLSARCQIWANLEKEKSGTPSQIAATINEDAANGTPEEKISWTIVHAWSRFERKSKEDVISAPQDSRSPRGVTPVYWCKQLLNKNIQVVPVEELLWRLRIQHGNRDSNKDFNNITVE